MSPVYLSQFARQSMRQLNPMYNHAFAAMMAASMYVKTEFLDSSHSDMNLNFMYNRNIPANNCKVFHDCVWNQISIIFSFIDDLNWNRAEHLAHVLFISSAPFSAIIIIVDAVMCPERIIGILKTKNNHSNSIESDIKKSYKLKSHEWNSNAGINDSKTFDALGGANVMHA